jgi:hypothetical protein
MALNSAMRAMRPGSYPGLPRATSRLFARAPGRVAHWVSGGFPLRIACVFLHVERCRSSKRVWRSPRITFFFTAFLFQNFNVKATPKRVEFTAQALHAGRPCKWNTFVQPAVCSAEFSGEMGPKTADLAFGYATCLMADAQNGSGCTPGTSIAL